jgi:iron(III) transport system ATP-binding protein
MPEITVTDLTVGFGGTAVLEDTTFTVRDGEFFTLLGPSGCGKTTTLLSIAGFLKPSGGVIRCGDDTFVDRARKVHVPAERRNLGMVFQSYAIWPHMTVAENVAFPLRTRRIPRRDRAQRVTDTLALVELDGLERRYPHQLSGGQRQRVALARAIVYQPSVLLLDEPFSNLDAKLRERARSWLKHLQQRLELTTLFVTHDQDEALAMSDRIVVMDQGQIQQIGTPEELYHQPANRFVASFLGRCNVLEGVVRRAAQNGAVEVELGAGGLRLLVAGSADAPAPGRVSVAIRPEAIHLTTNGMSDGREGANRFDVTVTDVSFLGDHYEYRLRAADLTILAQSPHQIGATGLTAVVDPDACRLM